MKRLINYFLKGRGVPEFVYELSDEHIKFIKEQKVFFVGSVDREGETNISPKGILPLKVLDKKSVAYLGLHGTGNRTAEDIASGSKITLMFCNFGTEPKILRLFCDGEAIKKGDPHFEEMLSLWDARLRGKTRDIFIFKVRKVQRSCGWGVPVFEYRGEKETFNKLTGMP